MKKNIAIVLAGGKGKRMGTEIPKQYIEVFGKPILAYTLETFQNSAHIDEIILVAGKEEVEFCKENIVEKYGLSKVTNVVAGGKERYDSVYEGLKAASGANYVFIHDGARPLVDEDIISRAENCVRETGACVVGVKAKDTIKKVNKAEYAVETLDRNELWQVQTPQVFEYKLVLQAYENALKGDTTNITDDGMVVEENSHVAVKLVEGSYENIKITTPVDITFMEAILNKRVQGK